MERSSLTINKRSNRKKENIKGVLEGWTEVLCSFTKTYRSDIKCNFSPQLEIMTDRPSIRQTRGFHREVALQISHIYPNIH